MFSTHNSKKPVLFLQGPLTTPDFTSSIAQHLARKCEKRGELAGSFFFSSTRPKCHSVDRFVVTLALQLSQNIPGFHNGLVKSLNEDPFITQRPIPTQVERLVLEPLRNVTETSHGPYLVVVDALDKCEGKEQQSEVLAQIARIVRRRHDVI
ncbi:hypothetical protein C0991_008168 [Blastosporella zonata]|nr:hypothetical protein C0991_008168 [Blastosporella zonata]